MDSLARNLAQTRGKAWVLVWGLARDIGQPLIPPALKRSVILT